MHMVAPAYANEAGHIITNPV